MKAKEFILNMGPQHPSTHGVLRLVLALDGEYVKDSRVHIGHLHRGIEKLCENKTYFQIVPLTDRLDYVSSISNNLSYVQAVEKLLELSVPERAKYLRVIFSELQRLCNHLLWLATQALDIGAMSMFLYCFRDREEILDIFEKVCGARLTINYLRVGGVNRDMQPDVIPMILKFTKYFSNSIKEWDTILSGNRIWLGRTKGIAAVTKEDAVNYGLTGVPLRASGINLDIRKAIPYAVYDRMNFDVPLGVNGDVFDRYIIRMEEMRQSLRIIEQACKEIPDGPIMVDDPRIALPDKKNLEANAECLTRYCYILTHGYKVPKGEVYSSIEAPKGELGFYIISDGTEKPFRLKIRSPAFINVAALPKMIQGGLVADVIAAIGSIDIVLGEIDR
ncbi:NADH-quinone oxidoreductase subunit D [Candidatus Desantisbacteria bacterium]|nr:NADH-quinone oxidoreductase subunit D [Candidatus Desantisbacteria bacterium]